ncbi:MAG: hypothetical protein KA236_04900 [Verrucomicrobia bacterium]|jgi:hypothetical protein|nr:hypothetical protein [Verrucomicrobiota bacterium]
MLKKFWSKEKKETRRFYLLPGMGGRAYYRKKRRIRIIAVVVGLLVSALFALAMYFMNNQRPR